MDAVYSKRENLFVKGETVYRILPDRFVVERPGEPARALPLAEVATVRAAFAPTQAKTSRHVLVITWRNGLRVAVDNVHFRGIADFEDRSGPYAAFARAAVAAIAQAAPGARAATGASRAGYVAQVVFVTVAYAALAAVLIALPVDLGSMSIVKLAIVAFFLPVLVRWAIKSYPRSVPLDPAALAAGLPD